jgi:hypothetical protein
MGREIRKVPKNWEHPKDEQGKYKPMVDEQEWTEEEAVCFQIYETVSEGTPVSPVFDTLADMEDWLVNMKYYSRDETKEFCKQGWTPSFEMNTRSNGNVENILPNISIEPKTDLAAIYKKLENSSVSGLRRKRKKR